MEESFPQAPGWSFDAESQGSRYLMVHVQSSLEGKPEDVWFPTTAFDARGHCLEVMYQYDVPREIISDVRSKLDLYLDQQRRAGDGNPTHEGFSYESETVTFSIQRYMREAAEDIGTVLDFDRTGLCYFRRMSFVPCERQSCDVPRELHWCLLNGAQRTHVLETQEQRERWRPNRSAGW